MAAVSRNYNPYGSKIPVIPRDKVERQKQDYTRKKEMEIDSALRASMKSESLRGFRDVAAVLVCAFVLVAVLVGYIVSVSGVRTAMLNAEKTKLTYQEKLTENQQLILEIEEAVNYEELYDYGIHELGMVFPGKQQIIYFDSHETEYVTCHMEFMDE